MLVSFILPAHNEELLLPAALASIAQAARDVPHEVIVVDDASTDGTADVARRHGARVVAVALRQIAAVRNAGAREARGGVLVFLDADTVLPAKTFALAMEAIETGAVGGGAYIRFDRPVRWSARLLVALWRAIQWATRWAAGAFVFARRTDFEAAGGFDERYFAGEELVLSKALKKRGRFVLLPAHVVTSSRKARTHRPGEIFVLMVTLALRGPKALQRRDGLDLWYKRREE